MPAAMTASKKARRTPVPMNGVDTPALFATINAVGAQPELAKFQFRAKSHGLSGTHSQSTMHGFFGAGAEHTHVAPYTAEGDHPAVLTGADAAPTPVEWVLHALASCLTAGIGTIAAARGSNSTGSSWTVEGDIDLRGVLGLSGEVRNGYQDIKVSFEIDGDASPEQLQKIVMQSKARSAVYDIVTNGVRCRSPSRRRRSPSPRGCPALTGRPRSTLSEGHDIMHTTDVIIIGGGEAGLAMSRSLALGGVDHVVLERGRIGERWHSERWRSLNLLTTNAMSVLPGLPDDGNDPDAFMPAGAFAAYLKLYALSMGSPVVSGVEVTEVEPTAGGYRVSTTAGEWRSQAVVVATGACETPFRPAMAQSLAAPILEVSPTSYWEPGQFPDGGVLVVGASSTGAELAEEIHASGRPVTLAVGDHTRVPRRYRGRDIYAWMETAGILDDPALEGGNLDAARRQPSLQLVGRPDNRDLDLGVLTGWACGSWAGSWPSTAQKPSSPATSIGRRRPRIRACCAS